MVEITIKTNILRKRKDNILETIIQSKRKFFTSVNQIFMILNNQQFKTKVKVGFQERSYQRFQLLSCHKKKIRIQNSKLRNHDIDEAESYLMTQIETVAPIR